jgi:thioredoxin reductase
MKARRGSTRRIELLDAAIIGGGPAGLTAALVLGRCCRSVLVLDAGRPRNYAARGIHNFPTRNGVSPTRFREMARREAVRHGAILRDVAAESVRRVDRGFEIRTRDGERIRSRLLLIATGVLDVLPDLPQAAELYGQCLHHCPYCDAWEYRGAPLVAFGTDRRGLGLAKSLLTWSDKITVVTNGRPLGRGTIREANRLGVAVRAERIVQCETGTRASRCRLRAIHFERGPALKARAIFFNTGQIQRCDLAVSLGCGVRQDGGLLCDRRQRSGIPGLYLAGDAAKEVQFAIVAASEGATAAVAMNAELQRQDLENA